MLKIEWKAMVDDLYRGRFVLPLLVFVGCLLVGNIYRDGNSLADRLESAWIALPIVLAIFVVARLARYLYFDFIRWEPRDE